MQRRIVYDIETIVNVFTCCCLDVDTGIEQRFVVCSWRNDFEEMVDYLEGCSLMIGFNNIGFDWMVLAPFLQQKDKYSGKRGHTLAKMFYKRSQKIIEEARDKTPRKKKERVEMTIPQLDLYRVYHFNNRARSTSLKWLEVCMHFPNVKEMDHRHSKELKPWNLDELLNYNMNDVRATYEFWKLSKDKLAFRESLSEKYGRNMMNFPDTRIGEAIFMMRLSERMGVSERDLRDGRTPRNEMVVKDFLLSGIEFESKPFQKILERYRGMVIRETKKDKSKKNRKGEDVLDKCLFDGVEYVFGLGGIHGLRSNGVYENLVDVDVSSYYPNLAISNRFAPEHLGDAFCDVYQSIYEDRKIYPKGSPENGAFKLGLNAVFGASNAPWSVFYDPQFAMSITINGQFLLAMLCERITLSGAGRVIQANTDGITVDVKNNDTLLQVCKDWEQKFRLTLEYSRYRKLAIANVNNYIGVTDDGKVKEKGAFETTPEIHKSQSMLIVAKAVREQFVNGTPIQETINNCNDLKEFIIGNRAKTGNLRYRAIDKQKGTLINANVPKNLRFYVSHSGGSIVKVTDDKKGGERITKLIDGQVMTMCNVWPTKPFEDLGVYKPWYITQARKLLESAIKSQTTLF